MHSIRQYRFKLRINPIYVLVCVVALLLMGSTSWAATYYVDKTAGRDANPGTQSQPWQNCPGMVGWSGSATLKAGDIVYFDSADTWALSGNVNSGIRLVGGVTYDGRTWGNGERATIKALSDFTWAAISMLDDHPSIPTVFRGFHVDCNDRKIHGVGVNYPVSQKSLLGATKRVEDCVVHDVYARYPDTRYVMKVGATKNYETRNVEILNSKVYNTPRSGIGIYAAVTSSQNIIRNVTVRGCEVYNAGEDPEAGGDGIMFKNNVINGVMEYNYVYNVKGRGLAVYNTSGIQGPTNAKVRHNIVTNCSKGGAYVATNTDKSVEIYGNLIYLNRSDGGSPGCGIYFETNLAGACSAKIYNNTLYQNAAGEIYIANSSARFTTLDIRNNILYSRADKYPLTSVTAGRITAHSNNLYYRPGGGNLVKEGSANFTAANLASWEPTGVSSDPQFVNAASPPTGFTGAHGKDLRPNTEGFNFKAASGAWERGMDIGSAYNSSINSIVRYGKWDIGAYETGTATALGPKPPSNLRVLN